MIKKSTIAIAALSATLALSRENVIAQDVHFTQFSATPLLLNPAFTGNFNGTWRAAAIYRDQWRSVTPNAFRTYGVSVDMPLVHDLTVDDYLAGGIQLYNDVAGDGNLSNFSGLLSLAYHKFLGAQVDKSLSVGFQGGYTQKSLDVSRLYFGSQFNNGQFSGPGPLDADLPVKYFTLNAGLAWAHAISDRVGYTIGLGGNNLNQPQESVLKKQNSEVGLGIRYTGQLGGIIYTGERFSLRPSVLYQTQTNASELVAGNEFHLIMGNPEFRSVATGLFIGAYWRKDDAIMANAGVEFKGLRIGVSYDYNISDLKTATNGNGGFEIALRYIAPNPLDFARKLEYPCARF